MSVLALPLIALMGANVMAVALVLGMTVLAGTAFGLVTWGLVLESRSNREWREREVAL
jgi:hypothetical protein